MSIIVLICHSCKGTLSRTEFTIASEEDLLVSQHIAGLTLQYLSILHRVCQMNVTKDEKVVAAILLLRQKWRSLPLIFRTMPNEVWMADFEAKIAYVSLLGPPDCASTLFWYDPRVLTHTIEAVFNECKAWQTCLLQALASRLNSCYDVGDIHSIDNHTELCDSFGSQL